MKLGFKRFMKRGQKGITLIELMVVMAILAVLASIVFPAVSGTQEVSVDSQVKQDASTVGNALNSFFADQTGAEVITSATTKILNNTTDQTVSSRWSENFTTAAYSNVFPIAATAVTEINIYDKDNISITTITDNATSMSFVNARTAIDLSRLATGNYIPAVPKSVSDTSGAFNNYLWMMLKTTASGGVPGGSRQVEIYKLTTVVQSASTYELTYRQIY